MEKSLTSIVTAQYIILPGFLVAVVFSFSISKEETDSSESSTFSCFAATSGVGLNAFDEACFYIFSVCFFWGLSNDL